MKPKNIKQSSTKTSSILKIIIALLMLILIAIISIIGINHYNTYLTETEDDTSIEKRDSKKDFSNNTEDSSSKKVSVDVNAKNKKLRIKVGTNAEWPPFEYYEEGQMTGFDIELIELICNELGYEPEIHDMAFEELLSSLISNRVDIVIAGMTSTEERENYADFSIPYIILDYMYEGDSVHDEYAIAVRKGSSLLIDINDCIKKLKNDGTIDKLADKWQVYDYNWPE